MTAKRFTIRSYNGIGCHIFDGSIVIAEVHRADIKQLCDLLNALHEENEKLKKDVKYWQKSSSYWSKQESMNDIVNDKLREENEQLKHNNKMLSMKMNEVYTKYRLLKEFSEDTNPNDAVKIILSELMQITKEYR